MRSTQILRIWGSYSQHSFFIFQPRTAKAGAAGLVLNTCKARKTLQLLMCGTSLLEDHKNKCKLTKFLPQLITLDSRLSVQYWLSMAFLLTLVMVGFCSHLHLPHGFWTWHQWGCLKIRDPKIWKWFISVKGQAPWWYHWKAWNALPLPYFALHSVPSSYRITWHHSTHTKPCPAFDDTVEFGVGSFPDCKILPGEDILWVPHIEYQNIKT